MAAEIDKGFGVKTELIESSGGVFEVEVDGSLIYSKKATGRFPEHSEVMEKLKGD